MRIDDDQRSRKLGHIPNALEIAPDLARLAVERRDHLLAVLMDLARLLQRLQLLKALEAQPDRAEVREHPTKPALCDVWDATTLSLGFDDVAGLSLGANEDHILAVSSERNGNFVRDDQTADRLAQVDDVDKVALAIDVRFHLRVPTARPMPEVNPGADKLFCCNDGQNSFLPETGTVKTQSTKRRLLLRRGSGVAGQTAGPHRKFRKAEQEVPCPNGAV